jgi:hypothetical protein
MRFEFRRSVVLSLAGLLWPLTPTMAGSYSAYASINLSVAVEDNSHSSFSIIPGTGETSTGGASGNAGYSNNVTYGLGGSLPPPLFPGVYNSSQSGGYADLPAGSSTSSSISIESEVFLTFTAPTLLAFQVDTSTVTSVQTSTTAEFAASFANASVYFDGSEVYNTSSTAGSFGNEYSYTTTSGGNSPIMYVYAHAGINEMDAVTYANGYAYTIAESSPPPTVPEPSSIVLLLLGAPPLLYRAFRRRT